MDSRKISVIIPTYNRASSLKKTIESVCNQNSEQWELIVIDDGSTDETHRTLAEYNDEERILYFYQKNAGVSAARNHGASKASGSWLVFLDSDDELTPDALSIFQRQIMKDESLQLLISGNNQVFSNKNVISLPQKSGYYPLLSGSFCVKKNLFERVGGYDPSLLFAENTELQIRMNHLKPNKSIIQEVTLIYYINSTGGSKNLQNKSDSIVIILDKHRNSLSPHVKHLYHQILGVNLMRIQNYSEARRALLKAWYYKPYKITTLGRLFIAMIPSLAMRLYPKNIAEK